MRRPRTTFSKAVVAIALSTATGVHAQQQPPTSTETAPSTAVPARSKSTFSFTPRSQARATPPSQKQPDPMAHARGARQLLRNGEDYLSYGQYDRALDFLREAESRQFELSDAERKTLNTDILRAQRGMRGLDDPDAVATNRQALGRRNTAASSASARPGAIVLSVPRSGESKLDDPQTIQLTSATREESGESARRPVSSGPGPESLPPLPPMDSVAPAQSPEPLSAPTESPEPRALSESAEPAILPPDVPGSIADEPPALAPLSPPADVAPPAEMPLSDPLPNAAPVEQPQPAEAPLSEPQPVVAEPPPPILLEEEEAAPVPVSTPKPTAAQPADEDPTALPALVLDETPATDPVPAEEAPAEELKIPETAAAELPTAPEPVQAPLPDPVMRTAQSEPIADDTPQPAPAPPAEEPPAPEASEVALPPLPEAITETPAAAQPAAPADSLAVPSLVDRASSALSEHKRPALSEESKRRIEQIARRQQEDSVRNPVSPIDAPQDSPMTGIDELSSNRLELPRAPSPTEIRPIRAIPIPEEFVPLTPRQWTPSRKAWTAAATCHGPLYFQDAVLERYGQSVEHAMGSKGRFLSYPLDDPRESNARNQILQPFYSIGLFASQVALLPYNMIVDPPWEAEYDLGYYRPGDRVPPDTIYLPISGVGPPLRGRHY